MRRCSVKKRLLKVTGEEHGFTLPEAIVTMVIMGIALIALHMVFNTSMRVWSFSNDKVESTENARVALERMEREIRAAYPPQSGDTLLNTWTPNEVSFQNQLGSGSPTTIGFSTSDGNLLSRSENGTARTLTALGSGGSLEFKYFDRSGDEVFPGGSESSVSMVRVKLVVYEDAPWKDTDYEDDLWGNAKQELITNVALRNRGT